MPKSAKKTARKKSAKIAVLSKRFTLDELSEQTNFATRTIRRYIQQGLLPSTGHGATALYDERHLDRLIFIRKVNHARALLAEIEDQLATMDNNEPIIEYARSLSLSKA